MLQVGLLHPIRHRCCLFVALLCAFVQQPCNHIRPAPDLTFPSSLLPVPTCSALPGPCVSPRAAEDGSTSRAAAAAARRPGKAQLPWSSHQGVLVVAPPPEDSFCSVPRRHIMGSAHPQCCLQLGSTICCTAAWYETLCALSLNLYTVGWRPAQISTSHLGSALHAGVHAYDFGRGHHHHPCQPGQGHHAWRQVSGVAPRHAWCTSTPEVHQGAPHWPFLHSDAVTRGFRAAGTTYLPAQGCGLRCIPSTAAQVQCRRHLVHAPLHRLDVLLREAKHSYIARSRGVQTPKRHTPPTMQTTGRMRTLSSRSAGWSVMPNTCPVAAPSAAAAAAAMKQGAAQQGPAAATVPRAGARRRPSR